MKFVLAGVGPPKYVICNENTIISWAFIPEEATKFDTIGDLLTFIHRHGHKWGSDKGTFFQTYEIFVLESE